MPGNIANPLWVDDPSFDITYHVRRSALPRPGGDAELLDFAARIQSRLLDRSRPLWEMYLVEGLSARHPDRDAAARHIRFRGRARRRPHDADVAARRGQQCDGFGPSGAAASARPG